MAQFDINFTPSFVPSGPTPDPLAVAKSRYDQMIGGLRPPQQAQPRGTQGPLYSGSKNAYFIGGREISARDEAGLLEAATTADFSVPYEAPAGDWAQVDTGQFGSMIQKIADPDLMTRMGKSFESGLASSGELLGATARFAGLEEPGKALMESSQRRQQELSPYSVGFTDIGKDPTVDVVDWIASTIGQLGPSIIETLAATAIGAAAGASVGGPAAPASATAGAVAGFFGKQAIKDALKAAVVTYEKQALKTAGKEAAEGVARQAAIKAAPKAEVVAALRATPEGVAALKTLRYAGAFTGGLIANVGSSYLTGIGDVTAEQLSSGLSPEQLNRMGIAAAAVPYAALESLPEATLFGRIASEAFGKTKNLAKTKTWVDRARSIIAKGGQQAALEGATEVGQEGIVLAANPLTNWNDPEIANRIINSFAAGALMGGALGGVSAFAPTDLLNPSRDINKDTEQGQQTQKGEEQPTQGELFPDAPIQRAPTGMQGPGFAEPVAAPASQRPVLERQLEQVRRAIRDGLAVTKKRLPDGTEINTSGATEPQLNAMRQALNELEAQLQRMDITGDRSPQSSLLGPLFLSPSAAPTLAPMQRPALRQTEQVVQGPTSPFPNPQGRLALPPPADFIGFPSGQVQARGQEAPGAQFLKGTRVQPGTEVSPQGELFAGAPVSQAPSPEVLGPQAPPAPIRQQPVQGDLLNATDLTFEEKAAQQGFAPQAPANPLMAARVRPVARQIDLRRGRAQAAPQVAAAQEQRAVEVEAAPSQITISTAAVKGPRPLKSANEARFKIVNWFNSFSVDAQTAVLRNMGGEANLVAYIKTIKKADTARINIERSARPYEVPPFEKVSQKENDVDSNELFPDITAKPVTPERAPKASRGPLKGKGTPAPKTEAAVPAETFQETKSEEQPVEAKVAKPAAEPAAAKPAAAEPAAAEPAAGGSELGLTTFLDDLNTLIDAKDPISDNTERTETRKSLSERATDLMRYDPNLLTRELTSDSEKNKRYVGSFYKRTLTGLVVQIDKDGYFTPDTAFAAAVAVEAEARDIIESADVVLLNGAAASDGGGSHFRVDGTPIANPMEVGRVKLLLNTIKSKLRIAPKTHVFRNLKELKSSNPTLYKAAKAARTEGDFDTVNAAGYSFGDTVILFSDNIQTEQQLRFVMAHETIGHFGLRSITDGASVNKLLNGLYDNDFRVRTATDAYMTRMGIPKLEAIEEVLADNAAYLDTSLLARITTFIKNALNKVGVTFGDEFAREIVSQLRKYVRYGELNGTPASATQLAENMIRLEEQARIGRYSATNTFANVAQGFNWLASLSNGVFTGRQDLLAETRRFLSDNKTNTKSLFKDVLDAFSTPQGLSVQNYGTREMNSTLTDMSHLRAMVISRLAEVAPDLHKIGKDDPELLQAEEMFIHRMLELYMNFKPGPEQKDPDLVYTDRFDPDGTPVRNVEAIAAYKKRILATPEMFKNGINFRDKTPPFKATVTADSSAYKFYSQMVDTLTEQQILRLQSVIQGGKVNENLAFSYLRNAEANDAQIAIIEEARRIYTSLAVKNAKVDKDSGQIKLDDEASAKANVFANQVARVMSKEFGNQKLKDWLEGNPKEGSEQFRTAEFDDFIKKLPTLNKLKLNSLTEVNSLIVNSVFNATTARDAQLYAKQSILRHYTPLDRAGEFAVKVAVVDGEGDTISLGRESMAHLPYYEFATKAEADRVMEELNKAFATQFTETGLRDIDGNPVRSDARLVAFSGAVSKTAEMRITVNPNMLLKAIENLGIRLPAEAVEKLVTRTTNQNAAARRNLERNVNPGFRRDIRSVQSEFSEFIASAVANNINRPKVDDLFRPHNRWMWVGSRGHLDKLKARIEAAPTADERRDREREYAAYATQFRYSADNTTSEGLSSVEINGTKYKLMGRGNKYREMAIRMVDTLNRSGGELVEVSEAIFGKGFGAKLRTFSVLAQLGGSLASGALNIIGLSTNTWSYLSYTNKQNGFGGGYGSAASALAINKALADTKQHKLNDIRYLKELEPGKHNLTRDEINFLIKVAEDGELAASQSQALMGSTRGRNPTTQKLMDGWMSFFNYTEQLTRRTTALATFRLEYQRQLARYGGRPTADQKSAALGRATKFAEAAVGYTQGRYGLMDRPELGRTGLLQYPFQYKQFVINTVELLANMDTSGRIQYLATMLLLAGVSGLPFAEDIGDLLDTLLSFFGIPRANVEKEMLMFYDSILPGSAEIINKGILDQLLGVSISSRVGMGNILPLTSAGVPGTDITRELMDFAGPVVGMLAGTTSFVDGILSMPLEAAGIKPGETSLRDVFRNSPITALRSVGDAWAYLDTGAIVSADGRMVADNVSGFTIFARLLGFYPAEASRQNNMVRLGKQSDAYRNDIAAKFRLDYIRAGMSNNMKGDREAMARVIDEVERWNKAAKGTGLEISNFVKNSRKALKDAQMSTAERFLKSTARANRPVMEELADAMGIE